MSIARSMLHDQSRAVCPCPCCMSISILHVRVHAPCLCQYPCTYIEMPECQTVRHPVSPVLDWKKLTMLEQVRYRTNLMQSGIFLVRCQTKIRDARMPMPALVYSMPMPSYEFIINCWPTELTADKSYVVINIADLDKYLSWQFH